MRVPILTRSGYVIAAIQSPPSDDDLVQLGDELARQVAAEHARGVIVDVTALDVMDSFTVRTLRRICDGIRLCGAETVIVGVQPDVAFALHQLGLTLHPVATAPDLAGGIEQLGRLARADRRDVQ